MREKPGLVVGETCTRPRRRTAARWAWVDDVPSSSLSRWSAERDAHSGGLTLQQIRAWIWALPKRPVTLSLALHSPGLIFYLSFAMRIITPPMYCVPGLLNGLRMARHLACGHSMIGIHTMLIHFSFPERKFSFICSIINLFNKYLLTDFRMSGTVILRTENEMREKQRQNLLVYNAVILIFGVTGSISGVVKPSNALKLEDGYFIWVTRSGFVPSRWYFLHLKHLLHSLKVLQSSFEAHYVDQCIEIVAQN